MANYKIKDLRGTQRRGFLRLMGAAAAGFALERSKLLNYLLDQGGSALAEEACAETNRHVGIISGGGNFCLWQLVFPLPDVAAAMNPAFAYHKPGEGTAINMDKPYFTSGPADRPFFYGPEAPFITGGVPDPKRPMTAFLSADPVVHHRKPLRQITINGALPGNAQGGDDGLAGGSVTLFAAIAALQRTTVSILPSIGIAPASLGNAPGAPALAVVPSADAMVDLFNSAAARAILQAPEDKAMFETYYKAILGLRDVAGRPTWAREIDTTKKAANLLGKNLAQKLMPTAADLTAYGVDQLQAATVFGGNDGKARLLNMAKALIITKKAFELGLSNQVLIGIPPEAGGANGFTDPHGAFDDMPGVIATIGFWGMFLNRFYADLATAADPACTGKKLDDTVILTIHGDHPHDPLSRPGWKDSTPGGSNWVYVMGNGHLPTGWHGHAKTDNTAEGIHPTTGMNMAYDPQKSAHAASAAILYAVAKGDMKKVTEFYKGEPITALVKPA
ncbi:hypothetical protein [Polyangium aurulentum]|uniref:hypothetical protein n=1 Tax=Polyangium aurulentum TaxID=2567896 RepID=UPI0010ADEABE|nr:hypothetical protein [Polyangium aurulentum]UQA57984.1 hypothetical protein E8A73_043065 [Polyangium aurulentum]